MNWRYIIDKKKQKNVNGGATMKNIVNRILSVFKRKDGKEFHFNDTRRACKSASKELGTYCEGVKTTVKYRR